MNKRRAYYIFSMFFFLLLTSCGKKNFTNWGFESGTLDGWQASGDLDAFQVTDAKQYDENTRYYLQEGEFHVVSSKLAKGTLRSPTFKINESGYISFLLSDAPDEETTYVQVIDAQTKAVLAKIHNEYYNAPYQTSTYVRYNVDLSKYLNKTVYIEVVDDSPIAEINFDNLIITITKEQLTDFFDDTNIRLGIAHHEDARTAADLYTKLNMWKVLSENRFNYHLMSQIGWMNDPNGFSYYHDKIHLFYQHNPYSTNWGPMHWGHATSTDFVKWEHHPTALAPDKGYDVVGAFSGSTIEFNDVIYTLYTGASHEGQVQALAISNDGITFEKYENNPVIGEKHLPANTTIADFRDPKMFRRGDYIYAIISARNATNEFSSLLLYRTKDMYNWEYAGKPFSNGPLYSSTLGVMLECPDLVTVDGHDLIIVSPQTATNHRNSDGNVYIVGEMNWQTGVLENVNYETIEEIDHGFDFYAPTSLTLPDGRVVIVAWMAGWNRTPVTSQFGYAGAQTFPRTINMQNGKLVQWPVAEIKSYYQNEYKATVTLENEKQYVSLLAGRSKDISLAFEPDDGRTSFQVFDNKAGGYLHIYYENGYTYLDRTAINNGYFPQAASHNITRVATPLIDGKVKIRMLLDKYSVEVFVSDGLGAMTATMMTDSLNAHFGISANYPKSIHIESYDVVV